MVDTGVTVKVLFLGGFDPAVLKGVYRGDGIATGTAVGEVFVSLIECKNRGHIGILLIRLCSKCVAQAEPAWKSVEIVIMGCWVTFVSVVVKAVNEVTPSPLLLCPTIFFLQLRADQSDPVPETGWADPHGSRKMTGLFRYFRFSRVSPA